MDRHFFNDHTTLVARSLRGLVASNPRLNLIPSQKVSSGARSRSAGPASPSPPSASALRLLSALPALPPCAPSPHIRLTPQVIYRADADRSKVSLLCGGGSGHEPGTVGFVGAGLLSASVAGDVFASPSAKQVLAGIRAVPSDKGTILIITNCESRRRAPQVRVPKTSSSQLAHTAKIWALCWATTRARFARPLARSLALTPDTGDNLHFGLARLMAQAQGIPNVELVVVGDDVSVPRSRGKMVGRRCLAGITMGESRPASRRRAGRLVVMLAGSWQLAALRSPLTAVCKIMGAASEEDMDFAPLLALGRSLAANIGSVCVALEHCHVPGRAEFASIPAGRIEIGLGLHNETGVMNVPLPSPEDLIRTMLDLILDQDDAERAFVPFADGDVTVLMVNNQGGLSPLELGAVVDETLKQLAERGVHPERVLSGVFMGSMNMPGMSLSILNASNVAREAGLAVDRLLQLLDAPHAAPAWPATSTVYPLPAKLQKRPLADRLTEVAPEARAAAPSGPTLDGNAELVQRILRKAAQDVVALEPRLTHWDTLVGDGDCGETCAAGGKAVLAHLDSSLATADLVALFRELTEVIDDAMGGTLGAIFSIFLAGVTTATMAAAARDPQPSVTPRLLGQLAMRGLETLQARTAARVGHRTVMDALIPFAETLANSGDVVAAAQAARDGGEGTARLTAKLGRAAYVGDREDVDMPPDPGAMAFVAVAEAIAECSS